MIALLYTSNFVWLDYVKILCWSTPHIPFVDQEPGLATQIIRYVAQNGWLYTPKWSGGHPWFPPIKHDPQLCCEHNRCRHGK